MARKQNMKRCTKTGKMFPATPEFFYRDKSQKDGLSPWSKEAEKAYNKAYFSALKKAKVNRKKDISEKDTKKRNVFEGAMKQERVARKSATKATKIAPTKNVQKARTTRRTAKATKSA